VGQRQAAAEQRPRAGRPAVEGRVERGEDATALLEHVVHVGVLVDHRRHRRAEGLAVRLVVGSGAAVGGHGQDRPGGLRAEQIGQPGGTFEHDERPGAPEPAHDAERQPGGDLLGRHVGGDHPGDHGLGLVGVARHDEGLERRPHPVDPGQRRGRLRPEARRRAGQTLGQSRRDVGEDEDRAASVERREEVEHVGHGGRLGVEARVAWVAP
jgi:hypothetical protein